MDEIIPYLIGYKQGSRNGGSVATEEIFTFKLPTEFSDGIQTKGENILVNDSTTLNQISTIIEAYKNGEMICMEIEDEGDIHYPLFVKKNQSASESNSNITLAYILHSSDFIPNQSKVDVLLVNIRDQDSAIEVKLVELDIGSGQNKLTNEDAIELLSETGFVEPVTDEDGKIFIDSVDVIYTI